MANHKRRRPKNRRAGCLLCKPHKANHAEMKTRDMASVRRRMQDDPSYRVRMREQTGVS